MSALERVAGDDRLQQLMVALLRLELGRSETYEDAARVLTNRSRPRKPGDRKRRIGDERLDFCRRR